MPSAPLVPYHVPTVIRTSTGEEFTATLAAALAPLLRVGDVLTLEGDLGAGKTTLSRALALSLGVDASLISSPTYVLVNVYPVRAGANTARAQPNIKRVVHADCYRMTGADDMDALGWDQLFDPHTRATIDGIAIVEWPGRLPDPAMLPPRDAALRVTIEATSHQDRRITLVFPDSWRTRAHFERFAEREPTRCPTTGAWVSPLAGSYPFADSRARHADLFKWFSGQYTASRPVKPEDVEDEV